MVKDGLLAIIPWMSPEWIVYLTLRLINQLPGDSVCNIIHFTNGGNFCQLGNRILAVFLTRDSDIPLKSSMLTRSTATIIGLVAKHFQFKSMLRPILSCINDTSAMETTDIL